MKEKKREKQQEGKIKWKTWEEEKERHKFNEKQEGEEECREGRGGKMIEREIEREREGVSERDMQNNRGISLKIVTCSLL